MSFYTPLDDDDSVNGKLISVELFSSIADNINYLIDSNPVGKVIMVAYGLSGVPVPNPEIWQLCDGSEITNEHSPLRGNPTPNYATVGRYLRGYNTVGEIGNYGGANTKNLQHNHTGLTDGSGFEILVDTDNDGYTSVLHYHAISSDLSTSINFEPAHVRINHYIKIR